ncbi:hypothetical protein BJX68DRAFT_31885 [Aspergillus pseudodeflectus]|uniref:DUF1770-domain-containing protein n=1 Tax=Aspergillus pseudodeflectus TaxID=176178 RepID=A0ABR4KQY6_9EURO
MADPAIQVAETIQTASINRAPSAQRDINPPTAASTSEKKAVPVELTPSDADSIPSDVVDQHHRVLRPVSRRHTLPPLPDLRFEQSYLASIRGADTWARVAWITIRDQVLFPLAQGTLWTLALSGWRYWNRTASLSGQTLGSRIRRWWYEVNNWKLPQLPKNPSKATAAQVEDFLQFYTAQFSNAGSD